MVVFEPKSRTQPHLFYKSTPLFANKKVDCKTVCIFAYSSTCEQSNKRSGTRLKMESETGVDFLSPHMLCRHVRLVHFAQPRSQSSSGISDMTSPVKLVGKVCAITLASKPPLVTRIARTGLGTRLHFTYETLKPRLTGEKKWLFSSLIKEALLWGYTYCVPRLNFKTHCLTFWRASHVPVSVSLQYCICTCLCHFPASSHLCVICHLFICLLPSFLLSYVAASRHAKNGGIWNLGDVCLPREYLLNFIQSLPKDHGLWACGTICSVRSGQGSEFE